MNLSEINQGKPHNEKDEFDGTLRKFTEILVSNGNEIRRALDVINDMASQTNLLSINAAIVASRSNGGGAEFGIIAKEIRKLSTHSTSSAREIEGLVEKMQQDIELTSNRIEKLKKDEEERLKLEMNLNSLKAQNDLFIHILDQVESKVEVKDHTGKFYLINQAVAEDYGRPAREVIGKDDFAFYDKEVAAQYWESEKLIIEHRQDVVSLEKVVLNDQIKHWLIKKIPIFLPEYNDWGLLIVQNYVEPHHVEDQAYLNKLKLLYPDIDIKL